eukprot:scaffold1483_cov379-Prasinococcus_capsulatus_cf.AAC.21
MAAHQPPGQFRASCSILRRLAAFRRSQALSGERHEFGSLDYETPSQRIQLAKLSVDLIVILVSSSARPALALNLASSWELLVDVAWTIRARAAWGLRACGQCSYLPAPSMAYESRAKGSRSVLGQRPIFAEALKVRLLICLSMRLVGSCAIPGQET